jgi:hypothetical protein
MFKRNKEPDTYKEIDEASLKKLHLFESVDGNFNELGYNINYTRIPNGLIRTIITPEALDQLFIPLPASYFIVKD